MIIDKEAMIKSFEAYTPDIVGEIIDIFILEYPERIDNLEKSLANQDAELLRTTAHAYKGVLAHFSADSPWTLAKQLELKGKENDFSGTEEMLSQLKSDSEQMLDELFDIKEEHYS
jgi:HPt (histidine-containing phosphotransfer) domain-containing protein